MSHDRAVPQRQPKALAMIIVLSLPLNLLACEDAKNIKQNVEMQSSDSNSNQHNKSAPQLNDLKLEQYQALDLIYPMPTAQNYKIDFEYEEKDNLEIFYFDAKGQSVNEAISGGYFYKVLGKNSDSHTIMQGFYQDIGTMYTAPFIIREVVDINQLNDIDSYGTTAFFETKGKLILFSNNDKPGVIDTLLLVDGSYVMRMLTFDNYNQTAIVLYDDNEKINSILIDKKEDGVTTTDRFISFYENGSAQGEISMENLHTKHPVNTLLTWDEQGKKDSSPQAETNLKKAFQHSKSKFNTIANSHIALLN